MHTHKGKVIRRTAHNHTLERKKVKKDCEYMRTIKFNDGALGIRVKKEFQFVKPS